MKLNLPLQLGNGAVLLDTGVVDWHRPAYHSERYIYPIGFKVARLQDSYINPHKKVNYLFEVIDGGDEPAFRVTSEDDPGNPVVGKPSSNVAQIALNRIVDGKLKHGLRATYRKAVSGPHTFCFDRREVVEALARLPGAEKCKKYDQRIVLSSAAMTPYQRYQAPKTLPPPAEENDKADNDASRRSTTRQRSLQGQKRKASDAAESERKPKRAKDAEQDRKPRKEKQPEVRPKLAAKVENKSRPAQVNAAVPTQAPREDFGMTKLLSTYFKVEESRAASAGPGSVLECLTLCQPAELQKKIYQQCLQCTDEIGTSSTSSSQSNVTCMLRSVCAHPELGLSSIGSLSADQRDKLLREFPVSLENEFSPKLMLDCAQTRDKWIAMSPKISVLSTLIEHCLAEGECMVVFTESDSSFHVVAKALAVLKRDFVTISELTTHHSLLHDILSLPQNETGQSAYSKHIFLCKMASVRVPLFFVDKVVFFDAPVDKVHERQAMVSCVNPTTGKKKVHFYHLVLLKTVEERFCAGSWFMHYCGGTTVPSSDTPEVTKELSSKGAFLYSPEDVPQSRIRSVQDEFLGKFTSLLNIFRAPRHAVANTRAHVAADYFTVRSHKAHTHEVRASDLPETCEEFLAAFPASKDGENARAYTGTLKSRLVSGRAGKVNEAVGSTEAKDSDRATGACDSTGAKTADCPKEGSSAPANADEASRVCDAARNLSLLAGQIPPTKHHVASLQSNADASFHLLPLGIAHPRAVAASIAAVRGMVLLSEKPCAEWHQDALSDLANLQKRSEESESKPPPAKVRKVPGAYLSPRVQFPSVLAPLDTEEQKTLAGFQKQHGKRTEIQSKLQQMEKGVGEQELSLDAEETRQRRVVKTLAKRHSERRSKGAIPSS